MQANPRLLCVQNLQRSDAMKAITSASNASPASRECGHSE